MASQGPFRPGTIESVAPGDVVWTSPLSASGPDDVYANLTIPALDAQTQRLKATSFPFSIPPGAAINGILFDIERSQSPGRPDAQDAEFRVVKGGVAAGDDRALLGVSWPTVDTHQGYGGPDDKFGLTWSDTDIDANFGMQIAAVDGGGSAPIALIDDILATIYYTGGTSASASIVAAAALACRGSIAGHFDSRPGPVPDYSPRAASTAQYSRAQQPAGADYAERTGPAPAYAPPSQPTTGYSGRSAPDPDYAAPQPDATVYTPR